MGMKEERERMLRSQLRDSSMNQVVMKRIMHGDRTMRHILGEPEESVPSHDRITIYFPPLTEQFTEACFKEMGEVAIERLDATGDDLTIPERTMNLLDDVRHIYRFGVDKGLKDEVSEKPITDLDFMTRLDYSRMPGLISRSNLLVTFGKLPGWRSRPREMQTTLFSNFFKAFEINLTSCDFSSEDRDLVAEMVSAYGYILYMASRLSYILAGNSPENKTVVLSLLEGTKNGLRLRK